MNEKNPINAKIGAVGFYGAVAYFDTPGTRWL